MPPSSDRGRNQAIVRTCKTPVLLVIHIAGGEGHLARTLPLRVVARLRHLERMYSMDLLLLGVATVIIAVVLAVMR